MVLYHQSILSAFVNQKPVAFAAFLFIRHVAPPHPSIDGVVYCLRKTLCYISGMQEHIIYFANLRTKSHVSLLREVQARECSVSLQTIEFKSVKF